MVLENENVPNNFHSFLDLLGSISIGDWQIPIMGLIMLISSVLGIYFFSKYIATKILSSLRIIGLSANVHNSLKFLYKFVVFFVIAILISFLLDIQPKYIAIISGIVGAAISFASLKSINNFIAGVWITIIRPFHIGDYVNIGGIEGIIFEISLNYIKIKNIDKNIIMIPNLDCLNSNIVNYSISMRWLVDEIINISSDVENSRRMKNLDTKGKITLTNLEKKLTKLNNILQNMDLDINEMRPNKNKNRKKRFKYTDDDKIVRYNFLMKLQQKPQKNQIFLEKICLKWKNIFKIQPKFKIVGIYAQIHYNITIYTPDPMNIINHIEDFKKEVYQELYSNNSEFSSF